MNEANIRKYANLMKELGLTGLEITEDNVVVRMERNITAAPAAMPVINADTAAASAAEKQDYISVRSPMVGVFYAAPAENAEPYGMNLSDALLMQ